MWLLSWAKSVVAFVTISVPWFIYAVLSYSLTFTVGGPSMPLDCMFSYNVPCSSTSGRSLSSSYFLQLLSTILICFRYLNVYTTLKEPPLPKSDAKELHPDVNTTEGPLSFHNYLDDFLEAVRIFGFLEKPVRHRYAL